MPSYIVTTPEGKRLRINAPDGATKEDALRYAQENYKPTQSANAPSGMMGRPGSLRVPDFINRPLGLAAGSVAKAAASVPLMAAEAGAGIGNLVNRARGGEGSYSPTEDFNSLFARSGWPQPETGLEKATDFLSMLVAGSKMPGQSPLPLKKPTAADSAIQEGVKRNVPVFYDDVGGPTSKKIGTAAESLGPLGTGSGRATQAQAAKLAAGELVDSYATASDDVPVLIQQGLKRRLAGFRKATDALYKRTDAALAPSGPVDASTFRQAIAARIAKEQKLGSAADQDTIATLQKYLDAPDGDFAHWRQLRSSLGSDISDYYSGKAAIGSKGVDGLQDAKSVLDDAMAEHAKKAGGKGYAEWRKADAFYKENVVPFKETGFKDLVKTAEPEKAWRYLLANNTESRAVRMFNALDRKGRQAVKYGLLKEARDVATDPKGNFSPAKFSKYIEDHEEAVGTFFRGADRRDIDGFKNLMRHIERAGQYAENPPTGNRLIPFLLGGATVLEPTAAATVAGTGLAVRGAFQTEAGRSFLLAAAGMKPGSPEMGRLIETMTRYAGAASVAARSNDDGQ
jgi:hypothetical protein